MTDDFDDIPTVDGDDFELPDDPILGDPGELRVGGDRVGDVTDFDVSGFSFPSESLTASFGGVAEAVESAMWHTLIDGAATEHFVDGFDLGQLNDLHHDLRVEGYATDRLSRKEIYGTPDADVDVDGAAFFAGVDAFEAIVDAYDAMNRLPDPRDEDDEDHVDDPRSPRYHYHGFAIERSPSLPSHLIVMVDVDAIARVPNPGPSLPDRLAKYGLEAPLTVSSPIVVRDGGGIGVINIKQDVED